jgi:hypothetical protein
LVVCQDEKTRAFALDDPARVLRGQERVAIDEMQRAPNLFLAIKTSVDEDPSPGRFLITGLADRFGGAVAPVSRARRLKTIPLSPIPQAEIDQPLLPSLMGELFAGRLRARAFPAPLQDLIKRGLGGGFTEALSRVPARRQD